MVSANLAIALANMGQRIMLVDADLGGANLHTLFDIRTTDSGIGDFIYGKKSNRLADYAVETGIENVWFISGNGFIPGIANLEYGRKIRLLKALTRLDYDYVVLDLGAGTSYNVIDFISITQSTIIVTVPEPTAILAAYEFLKNVIYRIFNRHFGKRRRIMEVINTFKRAQGKVKGETIKVLIDLVAKVNSRAAGEMQKIVTSFHPALIINMASSDSITMGQGVVDICEHFLNVNLQFLGSIPYDRIVQTSAMKMKPFCIGWPESGPSQAISGIARQCLNTKFGTLSLNEQLDLDSEEQMQAKDQDDAVGEERKIADLLDGRRDTELSQLLGTFLSTTSAFINSDVTKETAEVSETEAEAKPVTDAHVGDVPLSMAVSIEPRFPDEAMSPIFAPVPESEDNPVPSLGFFNRFNPHKIAEAKTMRSLALIQKNPNGVDAMATIKLASAEAAHTPNQGWEWVKTGLALIEVQQKGAARQAFAHAMVCLPRNDVAVNNWAATQILTETTSSPAYVLTNQIHVSPESGPLWFNLGLIQLMLKDYSNAAKSFQESLNLLVHKAPTHNRFLRAYCLLQKGNYDDARDIFRSIVQGESDQDQVAHARFNCGLCELRSGQNGEATEIFTAVLRGSPNDAEAFAGRGLASWHTLKTDQAISDFSCAIKIDPSNLGLRHARATICYQTGRLDITVKDLQRITELVPSNETFQDLLLKIRAELE